MTPSLIALAIAAYLIAIRILAGCVGYNDRNSEPRHTRRRGLLYPLRVIVQRVRYRLARHDYIHTTDQMRDHKARILIREHLRLRSLLDERTQDDIARQVTKAAKRHLLSGGM